MTDELFFVEQDRTVLADNTFSLNGVRYEAPRDLRSRKLQVRFDRKRLGRVVEGSEFFREFECQKRTVANYQDLDYSAVEGRLLSSSYAPQHDEPSCALMLADLRRIFDQCQRNGLVRMDYDTNIYFGKLSRARSLR